MTVRTIFNLDPRIRPAIKKLAKEQGRDIDWMANHLLINALGGLSEGNMGKDEVKVVMNFPKGVKIDKFEAIEEFRKNYNGDRYVTPKLFFSWLKDQEKEVTIGRDWFMIGKELKKDDKAEFMEWAWKNMVNDGNDNDFLALYKRWGGRVSQKTFKGWMNEWGALRGHRTVWMDGKMACVR